MKKLAYVGIDYQLDFLAIAVVIEGEKKIHETESLNFETFAFLMINMNRQIPRKTNPVFNNIWHKTMTILRRLSFDISLENDFSGLAFIFLYPADGV